MIEHDFGNAQKYFPVNISFYNPIKSISTVYSPYIFSYLRNKATNTPISLITQFSPEAGDRFITDNFGNQLDTNMYLNELREVFNTYCLSIEDIPPNNHVGTTLVKSRTEILDLLANREATTVAHLARIHTESIETVINHSLKNAFSIVIGSSVKDRISLWNIRHFHNSDLSDSIYSLIISSGTDVNSNPFKPEKGKQVEVGMKLQSPDQRIQGAIAWYDLKRQNVVVNDSVNPNEKVQRGEQLTRGIETELSAVILEGLKLTAAYTYTIDAEISKDANASNVGKALDNIPEHAYSLSARYKFDPSSKLGWYVGGGFRGETYKTVDGLDVHVPGYTVFDTEAGYDAERWGAQLAIRNLFDKDYYAGALNENLVITI